MSKPYLIKNLNLGVWVLRELMTHYPDWRSYVEIRPQDTGSRKVEFEFYNPTDEVKGWVRQYPGTAIPGYLVTLNIVRDIINDPSFYRDKS
jgi:hypothetical protein